jgi:hypothetical protein
MIAILLIITGIFFFMMVFNAYSSGELKARGWGFSTRIYRRDNEPIMYWISFMSYLMAAVFAAVFGVLAACKSFF